MITITIIHSCFYILLAAGVHCIYHWGGRLFLGGLGIVAFSSYFACWLVEQGLPSWLALILVGITGVLVVVAIGEILAGSSALVYAVFTFALVLCAVKLAGFPNPLTNGDAGINSPFWATANRTGDDRLTPILAIISVAIALVSYEILQRKGAFRYAELLAQSPLLATSLGLKPIEARLPTHVFAGLMFSLSGIVCVFKFQLIQPSIFSCGTSFLTLLIGFLVPRNRSWLLLGYGLVLVLLRLLIQAWTLDRATQLAGVIVGLLTLVIVLRLWRTPILPLKRLQFGKRTA